jgi:hypothetical protein
VSKYDYPGQWKEGAATFVGALLAVIAFALFVFPGLIFFIF